MQHLSTILRTKLTAAKRRMEGWAWLAIFAKLGLWALAFVALAHVGTGTVSRLLGVVPLSPTALHGAQQLQAVGFEPSSRPPTAPLAATPPSPSCRPRDGGTSSDDDAGAAEAPATTSDGRLILNRATMVNLVELPGIGPKRARAILDLRHRLGRFSRLEDLLRVRGIGRRSLGRLRPLVVVDPPKAP